MLGANPAEGLTRKAFRKYETIMKSQAAKVCHMRAPNM